MKLNEMNCPSCGATLEYNENDEICTCAYCKSTFIINGNRKKEKTIKNIITSKLIKGIIAPILVTTGAVVAITGLKNIRSMNNNAEIAIETEEGLILYNHIETEEELDTSSYDDPYELELSNNIEDRAKYLEDALKNLGILNEVTKKYYTKEELIDLINYVNGKYDKSELPTMFDKFFGLSLDILNSHLFIKNVNDNHDKPYNIHMAEAIIENKDSKEYEILLYLDNLHRKIINSDNKNERNELFDTYCRVIELLFANNFKYDDKIYSIDDLDISMKCLLLYCANNLILFDTSDILANYFNDAYGTTNYSKLLEDELNISNSKNYVSTKSI